MSLSGLVIASVTRPRLPWCRSLGFDQFQSAGLHHPPQLLVHKQAGVGLATGRGQFPHGHAGPGSEVEGTAVLHRPAGLRQQPIDPLASLGFRWQGGAGQGAI